MAQFRVQVELPLRVGERLASEETEHGGHAFIWELSREPGPFRVEAIGADWVVVRGGVNDSPHLFIGRPESLTKYREEQ